MAQPDRSGRRGRRALSRADTIFALSSGAPPAAIAIMRVSGPLAFATGVALAGRLPLPRTAALRTLRDRDGQPLDQALVMTFPATTSATGEDLVEFHCHGGRAVVAAIDRALFALPGLRRASGGEFTRRALLNGRIDLAQAEALGDLLQAETENERISAIAGVEGAVSRLIAGWQASLLTLSAQVEAIIDYDDESDVATNASPSMQLIDDVAALRVEMTAMVSRPTVERLRDGIRVVLAGPRNAGKSTLFNLLAGRDAAIVSPIAGTTRDRIEVPVQRDGITYLLIDTAGITETTDDPIEAMGIERSRSALATADLILWLDDTPPPRPDMIWVWARADLADRTDVPLGSVTVSQLDQDSVERLWDRMATIVAKCAPRRHVVLNDRQRERVAVAADMLIPETDPLAIAEQLRLARNSLSEISNAASTDMLLDRIFSQFCVGK